MNRRHRSSFPVFFLLSQTLFDQDGNCSKKIQQLSSLMMGPGRAHFSELSRAEKRLPEGPSSLLIVRFGRDCLVLLLSTLIDQPPSTSRDGIRISVSIGTQAIILSRTGYVNGLPSGIDPWWWSRPAFSRWKSVSEYKVSYLSSLPQITSN
jgi:hypothetical protein